MSTNHVATLENKKDSDEWGQADFLSIYREDDDTVLLSLTDYELADPNPTQIDISLDAKELLDAITGIMAQTGNEKSTWEVELYTGFANMEWGTYSKTVSDKTLAEAIEETMREARNLFKHLDEENELSFMGLMSYKEVEDSDSN